MTSFKLLFKRQKVISIIISVQIAAIIFMVLLMFSAYKNRMTYYGAVKDQLSTNGICVRQTTSSADTFTSEEAILDVFSKAKKVNVTRVVQLIDSSDNDIQPQISLCPDNIMALDQIKLIKGRYPQQTDNDLIECVVSESSRYDVGDEIMFLDTDDEMDIKVKVTGVFPNNQLVFGTGIQGGYDFKFDYRDFYYVMNSSRRSDPLFVTSESIGTSHKLRGTIPENTVMTIEFEDESSYTTSEILDLRDVYNFEYRGTCELYKQNSERTVKEQMMILLPISAAVLLITIFTVITTGILGTYNNIYNYAVLYLCGSTWKRCALMNIKKYALIEGAAIVMDFLFYIIFKNKFLNETVLLINYQTISICVAMCLLIFIIALIVPLAVVRKKQVKDVLKTEYRD